MEKTTKISIAKPFSQWLLILSVIAGLSAPVAGAENGPVGMLRDMTEQLIEMSSKNPEILADPVKLRAVANEVVLPHVDFMGFSRRVLGKYWRNATEAQQAAFAREFRELLLGTYLRSVSVYKDNRISFLPLREGKLGNRVKVKALVEQKNGPEVRVAFRVHRVDGKWLIYDVLVEGISLVATHRSTFAQEIHNNGIDSLIERLRAKNEANAEQLAAGAN